MRSRQEDNPGLTAVPSPEGKMSGLVKSNKRILVITYDFPPFGGVKVQRALKFARYLPSFGWKPTIVTVRNCERHMSDPELLKQIPTEAKVIRTFSLEPARTFKFLRYCYGKIRYWSRRAKTQDNLIDVESTPRHSWAARLDKFLFIPDNKIGWLPFTVISIIQQTGKNDFDAIFSTSPPFTSHLIGLVLKYLFKKPWIVDFRDLWVLNPWKKPPTKLHSNLSRYIEYKVLKFADKIVTVSDQLCEALKTSYPDIDPKKFVTIPNGYDRNDFEIQDVGGTQKFSVGHVGSLYLFSGRTPYHFLTALGQLKNDIPNFDSEIEVTFVGDIDRQNSKIIKEVVTQFNLENVVNCTNMVPHRKAIAEMNKFDVLLFLLGKASRGCPSSKGCFSGKLFEYLATGKPILALVEDGPVSDLIKTCRSGIIVDPENVDRIKEAILSYYNAHKKGELKIQPNRQIIARFERKELTKRLAGLLNELSATEA